MKIYPPNGLRVTRILGNVADMTSKTPTERVTEQLRRCLKQRHVSQLELARHLGVTRSSLNRRFTGEVPLSIDLAFQIVDYLNLHPSDVFDTAPAVTR